MTELVYIASTLIITSLTYWYVHRRLRSERRRAELAMVAFEARHSFRAIADCSPSMIWFAGPDGRFLFCNRYRLAFTGRHQHQEQGSGWLEAVHQDDRFACGQAYADAFRERLPFHFEYRLRRADGEYRWVHSQGVPWFEDGGFAGYVGSCVDITERREAEHSLHESREALRESLLGAERANAELAFQKFALDQHALVAITDGKGRITYVNDKFCEISKYAREELLGQDHRIINSGYHPKAFFRDMYAAIARGKVWHGEIRNRAKDGGIYWVDTTIVPFRDECGAVTRYVAIRADITEHKQMEESLVQSLERRQLLVRELNHRVRNNLAGLLGLVRLYERTGRNGREVAAAVGGKIRAMKEVHEMISSAPRMAVDLRSLVLRLARDAQPFAIEDDTRVRLLGPVVDVPASQAGAVAMVLQELFTNAIKYGSLSAPAGAVSVAWSLNGHGKGRPAIEVAWEESGGPPVVPPDSRGIGLNLIEGLAGAELHGACELDFDPRGLRVHLTIRVDQHLLPSEVVQPQLVGTA